MITGYKKKRLGHPSEKLSGDVPRAGWRAVIFSEVLFPIVTAILFVVAYMFVKSFPVNGKQQPPPLIRIAVIAVPSESAQHVLNLVVASGIKAILNFSPGTLEIPDDVKLKSVDLTVSLESLSFYLARGDSDET